MLRKSHSPNPGHVRVTFELPSCIWADRIFLTGDFNDWNETDLPLRQQRDGIWRVELDLPVDKEYEFRYIVDGKWQTDYHADGFTSNSFGSVNSVVFAKLDEAKEVDFRVGSKVREREGTPVPRSAPRRNVLPVSTSRPPQISAKQPVETAA